jgi:hypothetical protein
MRWPALPAKHAPGFYNWDKKDFGPRVSLAWSPHARSGLFHSLFGDGDKTVIRAGYGINYDPQPLAFVRDLIGNYPDTLNLSVSGATSFEPYGPLKIGIPALVVPDISSGVVPVPADGRKEEESLSGSGGRGFATPSSLRLNGALKSGRQASLPTERQNRTLGESRWAKLEDQSGPN